MGAEQPEQQAVRPEGRSQQFAPGRSVWRPTPGYGRLVGVSLCFGCGVIAVLSFLLLVQDEGPIRILWLLLLVGALAILVWVIRLLRGLDSMRYVLADDHLRIEHGKTVRQVPYDDMLQVVYHLRERLDLPGREPYWPGYRVSTIRTRGGVWHSFATVPPNRRVRITTPAAVFAISPERPILFIQELERRRMGRESGLLADIEVGDVGVAPGRPERRRPTAAWQARTAGLRQSIDLFRRELLTDTIASTLVAIGVIIPVFMLAYTFNEVDFLPQRIPLHWNADGELDRLAPSRAIWTLPLLALTVLVVNAGLATIVYRFDQVAARLLVAITPIAQITIAIALLRIIN